MVKESLSRSQRVFRCEACHFETDRDYNASINLDTAIRRTMTAEPSGWWRHFQEERKEKANDAYQLIVRLFGAESTPFDTRATKLG